MRVLALDSAFGGISAAIAEGKNVLALRHGAPGTKAAEHLPGLVGDTLAQAGLRLTDLDQIAVTLGPGGFTALRAGIAFAKGLSLGAGRPLLGITTLEALACSAGPGKGPIATVIDANRGEIFFQLFSADLDPISPPAVVKTDALGKAFSWPPHVRACGSGAHFLSAVSPIPVEDLAFSSPNPGAMAIHCQRFTPAERPAQAVYLRPADARPMA